MEGLIVSLEKYILNYTQDQRMNKDLHPYEDPELEMILTDFPDIIEEKENKTLLQQKLDRKIE